MNNLIIEYLPCQKLRPYIELYWEGSFNADASGRISMQMVPNGCLELIFHLNDLHCDLEKDDTWSQSPDYMVIGLFTKPYEVRFKNFVEVFSIRFKPEGVYSIFGIPASELKDTYHDMALILGDRFLDFSNRLKEEQSVISMIRQTEQFLLKNLMDRKIDMNYINFAAELIRNKKGVRIEDLPGQVCISQRQLEREFKNKVGISPKHYLRIIRINEVLRLLKDNKAIDLTSVAYHCGYYDQAHFINDFKNITGEKPSIFVRDKGQFIAAPGLAHYTH